MDEVCGTETKVGLTIGSDNIPISLVGLWDS